MIAVGKKIIEKRMNDLVFNIVNPPIWCDIVAKSRNFL